MDSSEDKENCEPPHRTPMKSEIIDENADFVTPDSKPTPDVLAEQLVPISPLIGSQGSFASSTAAGTSAEDSDEYEMEGEEGDGKRVTCRKEKSLGLLCQRFIDAMKEAVATDNNSVHLETVANKMKVEKRRIYDIVNVMEALDAMSKLNKSYYAWHGLNNLPRLMHELQRESIEENLPTKILQVEQAMCTFTDLSPGARRRDLVGSMLDAVLPPSISSGVSTVTSSPLDSPYSVKSFRVPTPTSIHSPSTSHSLRDPRGTKNSLAMLCRRFIMVLLANPQDRRRVSLDVASTVLIKDTETEGFDPPSRGRCRRLYDIANVLVAMGIIKKVHYLFGTKKIPLFIYSGPEPSESDVLSDEKLSEMMVMPRKAIDDVIREKTFGKRSKSEAYLDDAMRQQRAGKMSRLSSPMDSPATAAWKMMDLANAAEAERQRLLQERLAFAFPAQGNSPNSSRKRLTQSTSNLVLPGGHPNYASPSATGPMPTSPLALSAGNHHFVLPRTNPLMMYRTYSDLSVVGNGGFVRSPRTQQQPLVSPLSRYPPLSAALAAQAAAAAAMANMQQQHQQQQENVAAAHKAARRVLAPMQPSVTSPSSGGRVSPKKTPKYSIKNLLKSPAFKKAGAAAAAAAANNDTPEKEKVRIGTLEHRGNSLFRIVKKEAGEGENENKRRPFGSSANTNANTATLEILRTALGI